MGDFDCCSWPGAVNTPNTDTWRPARRNPDGTVTARVGDYTVKVKNPDVAATYTEDPHYLVKIEGAI